MKNSTGMFPLPSSFKWQIVLTFVAGFFLLGAAFVAYQVQVEKQFLYRDSNDRTMALARSLAISSRSWVLADDVAGLQEIMNSVRDDPGLRYAMVISPSGRVLAHTDASREGLFLEDQPSRLLLGAQPAARVLREDASFIDIAVPIVANNQLVGWARIGLERDFVVANLSRLIWSGILFVLISTALALIAALLVARRLGFRIGSLVQVTEQVQAGNFSTRAWIGESHDEIAKLAGSFNRMLDALALNQKELRAASRYTRSLIEASLDPLVTISVQGKITDVNKATEQITGRRREELIGTDFSDYFTAPDKARAGYQRVFEQGYVTDYPLALRHRDGHVTEVLYNASLYRDGESNVQGVFAAARDVTERNRTEHEVAQLNQQIRLILDSAGEGIFGMDTEGRCTFANPATARLLGFSVEELVGQRCHLLFHHTRPDGTAYPEQDCPIQAAYRLGTVHRGTDMYWRKDGSGIPVDYISTPIEDAGKIIGAVVAFNDITERKQAEEKLLRSEKWLKESQRIAHLGSWQVDFATNQVSWSEELYQMYGFDPALPPPSYTESMKLFTPESWDRLSAAMALAGEAGISYELELELVRKDGSRGWMLARGEPVHDARGAVVGVRGVVMDITGRKRAEQELEERERHSQSLLRLSRNLERAQAYAEVLNAARDEVRTIIGYQNLWAYLISDDRQTARALMAGGPLSDTVMSEEGTATLSIKGDRMMEEIAEAREIVLVEDAQTDARVNREIVTRLGNRTIVNVPIILFDRHMGSVGMGTFGDEGVRVPLPSEQKYLMALASHMATALDRIHLLGERRKAEMELRKLNNDFVTLLENTGDFIYFKDQDSRFIFCSQTLANITGHSNWRDMIGKNDLEVFPADTARIYHEEELPIFREGRPLLNKVDPYYDERGKRGWVSTNKWPVFGDDRKTVVGIFGISRDITELKEAENKITELNRELEYRVAERTAQLEAANKELEAFSYSVSHDLRTPLRAIDGFSHILLEDYAGKLDEEGKRLLNVVRNNTVRMGQLIDDILKFSRTRQLEMSVVDIDMRDLAREVMDELRLSADTDKLQLEIGALPPVRGDRAMLHQVFANLLSNAIKFSSKRAPPRIRVGGNVDGNEAIYFVQDNGAGFDMQYAAKLFGVFQRLHSTDEFEGTGIGLAIVKRIITRHGGRVWAEGKVDEGATIYFALPVKEAVHG